VPALLKGPLGRHSITPGRLYFRHCEFGVFEGMIRKGDCLDAGRSLVDAQISAYALTEEATPDHSHPISDPTVICGGNPPVRCRWVLKICEEGLVEGKTVSIDATMWKANAALRSLWCGGDNGQGI